MSPTQAGLAVGVVAVGCLMAFGAGVILGMWYKAKEQIAPYSVVMAPTTVESAAALSQAAAAPESEPPVTFYSMLKNNASTYAPLITGKGSGETRAGAPVAAVPAVAPPGVTATAPSPKKRLPGVEEALRPHMAPATDVPPDLSARKRVAEEESPPRPTSKTMQAEQGVKKRLATGGEEKPPAGTVTTVPAPPASVANKRSDHDETVPPKVAKQTSTPAPVGQGSKPRAPETDGGPRRSGEPVAPGVAASPASERHFSVQAGSFRTQQQAEQRRHQLTQRGYQAQIQLVTLPGNESWYRVRVSGFADREAASQAAQRLKAQEQIQAVVTPEAKDQ